ncbi:hypothetical protein OSB04_000442 [Centaurea solstitialis]|uniref:Exocyst complex subunit Exo70 C-terminal domain-containing protein n=1 Tax=Centaurea solstitialis TaxID=347529 RepID=A0AA38TZL9_9ASTR|nr:hypothetical protein OSB04_000442 [Centaurea solstitialis]
MLKERLQMFYTAFEEIYKSQTGWSIPNNQLREDLRISISLKFRQSLDVFLFHAMVVGGHTWPSGVMVEFLEWVCSIEDTEDEATTVIEQKLVAAASLIIRELDSNNKLSHKAKKRLVDLHAKLSSTSKIFEDEEEQEEEVSDIEKQIDSIKNKTMIWTYEPDEVKEYLKEVEGLRRLVESLESLKPSNESEEHRILMKGNDVLRTSIHRIQRLFERTLVHNRYNFVPTRVRFQSCEDDAVDPSSLDLFVDDGVDPSSLDLFVDDGVHLSSLVLFVDDSDDDSDENFISKREDVYIMHLIDPEEIPDLKSIANLMFDTGCNRDCVDSFISVCKDALDDLLFILKAEKSSVEDVLKMERVALSSKIKRWGKAMRIFVRIYLASEKFLCEQIFGQGETVSALYFSESSEASILQFLNFAEAFAVGYHESERIFMVLDLHDTLSDLTPDIKSFYPHENGSYLITKFQDVLSRIGDCTGAAFFDFTNVVKSDMSNIAIPTGGIHNLTLHVMSCVNTLVTTYGNSLNTIFTEHHERDDQDSTIDDERFNEFSSLSTMELCFQLLMDCLESNLEAKSSLYKEDALGHLFLMNNVHYMAKKVQGSKLRTILGGDWVREHKQKFRRYAMSYERSTWSPILKLLRDEGLNHLSISNLVSKSLLKERLKMFYTAFEEIYKSQTGWLIPNNNLRWDMRILISLKAIQAYRTFVVRIKQLFEHMLITGNRQNIKYELLSFWANEDDGDVSDDDPVQRDGMNTGFEDFLDLKPVMETVIEHKLIAAATLIIRELDSNNKLSHKAKKRLVDLHAKLSSASKIFEDEEEEEEVSDIEKRIDSIKNKIMIWTYEPDEVKEYLKEVDGLRQLVESLESSNSSKDREQHKLLTKASDVLRTSIARIAGLFKSTLVHNRYNFAPTRVPSSQDDGVDKSSIISFMDDSVDDSISKREDVYLMHLIDPEVIPYLKSIASIMCGMGYNRECVDSFISVRKDVLDDLLFILEIEKSSIKDVLKMELVELSSKIKRWGKAMRIFVRIYLASEKFLCEQIFGQGESVSVLYFSKSSEASILQFLNFADTLTFEPHGHNHIFLILDMHDTLANLTPDIESSYPDENGSYLRTKFQDVLNRVGDSVYVTFFDFTDVVKFKMWNAAFPKGGIQHLTRHVMNYVTALLGYRNSLNTIFRDDQDSNSEDTNFNEISFLSPMGLRFLSLMSTLESRLEENSRIYKEDALGHLFLMNNVHYMTEKVKGSKLRSMLGGDWVREHNRKFQDYAMSYERSTWSPILKLLSHEGLYNPDSSKKKTLLKKRLQMFYTAFEEIYESQTGWLIPNNELRKDMRISISVKVCQGYRSFIGLNRDHIDEKYIKYSADDLENYLLDLFEGSAKSL